VVVESPVLVAEHLSSLPGAALDRVSGDHQPGPKAKLGIPLGHCLVRTGVQAAHPADADQANADLAGRSVGAPPDLGIVLGLNRCLRHRVNPSV